MGRKVAKPDARLAEIAGSQYGVVSLAQLRRLGFSEKMIGRRVAAARLHRVHRGVFAVGHSALSAEGCWLAAVLAVGRGPFDGAELVLEHWGAAVSHRSAASLWDLLPVTRRVCDVIVAGDTGRAQRAGIRVHRSLSLRARDATLRHRIPVTTPARTIADLRRAGSEGRPWALSSWELRKAIRQAVVLDLPIGDEKGDRTRSDLERDFLLLCRRNRLPRPEVNVRVGSYLVDFHWPDRRVVVETDSYLYHRGKVAFQDDRARDLDLRRRGFEVLRLSEKQVNEQPEVVAEVVAEALSSAP